MWVGVATQKNGLALLSVFAIFFLIWSLVRRRQGLEIPATWYQTYMDVFIILLSIWLFMGPNHVPTYSSTSLMALILGLAALSGLLWLKRRNIILSTNLLLPVFIVIVIVYGIYTPFAGGLTGIDISSLLGRDQTLTGRSEVWARLIPFAMQKPFLGHGYSSFWTDEFRETIEATAHNGYLDMILNTGIVGIIFWSIFLIASCRNAQKEMPRNYDWGCFWFCIILMAVVHNIAESSMISFVNLLPVTVLFLSVSLQAPAGMAHSPSA
jgi:O-antigen ligase